MLRRAIQKSLLVVPCRFMTGLLPEGSISYGFFIANSIFVVLLTSIAVFGLLKRKIQRI